MAKGTSAKQFITSFFGAISRNKISQQEVSLADQFFLELRADLIDAIVNSEVSQELINHSTPSSILGTPGSLFGFLGLIEGQEPVDEIIEVVKSVMKYKLSRRIIKGGLKMTVTLPTIEDFRNSPGLILPWEGGYTIVEAIEKGLSGLQNYLSHGNLANSRSAEGIQTQNRVRGTNYQKRGWITPILNDVKDRAKSFR